MKAVLRSVAMLSFAAVVAAQTSTLPTKVRAVIVDKDLNQKAVPQLTIVIRKSGTQAVSAEAITSLEGTAAVQLEPGRYTITTTRPIEFQGQSFSWTFEFDVSPSGAEVLLSNNNAEIDSAAPRRARITDELTSLFQRYQHSVVTVWSEFGRGTGFIIDSSGLILTNQHVIGPAEYVAVQFDAQLKVPALILSKDAAKDIAVLSADISMFRTAIPALLSPSTGQPSIEEGERVFTIGSPLSQRKILTTGMASKVEAKAIISDININPGNSGGPLFNSIGEVVGITTFAEVSKGPGISGIVRIEEALPLIEAAKKQKPTSSKAVATLLPVEPAGEFPIEAIKAAAEIEKFDVKPYRLDVDKFDVTLITPILRYRYLASEVRAGKEKEKRTKKSQTAVKGTFQPLDDLRNWGEYAGAYKPVLMVRATPEFAETTGSIFLRGLVSPYIPAKLRFKADFYKMKLFGGSQEIQPIHPGKIAHVIDMQSRFVNATDATYEGLYVYPYGAINDKCGEVRLELFTEKEPNKAHEKKLNTNTIQKVAADFLPFRDFLAARKDAREPRDGGTQGAPVPTPSSTPTSDAVPAQAETTAPPR